MNKKRICILQKIFSVQHLFLKNLLASFLYSFLMITIYIAALLINGWLLSYTLFLLMLLLFFFSTALFNIWQSLQILLPAIKKTYPSLIQSKSLSSFNIILQRFSEFKHYLIFSDWILFLTKFICLNQKATVVKHTLRKILFWLIIFIPFSLITIFSTGFTNSKILLFLLFLAWLFANFIFQAFFKLYLLFALTEQSN